MGLNLVNELTMNMVTKLGRSLHHNAKMMYYDNIHRFTGSMLCISLSSLKIFKIFLMYKCTGKFPLLSLGGDKSEYVNPYIPTQPRRKNSETICNHQADSPLYVWPDV